MYHISALKYYKVSDIYGKIIVYFFWRVDEVAKGSYKISVKVTAKGSSNYLSGSKTVTVTVKTCA